VGHRLLEGSAAKYFFLADGANDKLHVFDRALRFINKDVAPMAEAKQGNAPARGG
jgi:hypothetical protein